MYLGGGTPTLLRPNDIIEYFNFLDSKFDRTSNFCATIEATPYSITHELAEAFVKARIDTVILGVQSFNENILKKINRPQKNHHVDSAVKILREAGIKKNFDLIVGLEDQGIEQFEEEIVANIFRLRPTGHKTYLLQQTKLASI